MCQMIFVSIVSETKPTNVAAYLRQYVSMSVCQYVSVLLTINILLL